MVVLEEDIPFHPRYVPDQDDDEVSSIKSC